MRLQAGRWDILSRLVGNRWFLGARRGRSVRHLGGGTLGSANNLDAELLADGHVEVVSHQGKVMLLSSSYDPSIWHGQCSPPAGRPMHGRGIKRNRVFIDRNDGKLLHDERSQCGEPRRSPVGAFSTDDYFSNGPHL